MNALLKVIEDKKREIDSFSDKKKELESLVARASELEQEIENFDEEVANAEYYELKSYAIQLGLIENPNTATESNEAVEDVTETTVVTEY